MKKQTILALIIILICFFSIDLWAQLSEKAQKDMYVTQAKKYIEKGDEKKTIKYLKKLEKIDSTLSKEMKTELYMTKVTIHLKKKNHRSALKYMNKIKALGLDLPIRFYYFSGRSLLKTGALRKAKTDLMKYINGAGDGGKYYSKALGLIGDVENEMDTRKQEKNIWLAASENLTKLKAYVRKYPHGRYISQANKDIRRLDLPRSADRRYIDQRNGTIKDTRTDLVWTRKDSYADLGKCLDWNASGSYIRKLRTGGFNDWRMPTIQELKGIFEKSKRNKDYSGNTVRLDTIFAQGGAYWYWSSETAGSCCARYMYFGNGYVNEVYRGFCGDDGGGVRAVRR